MIINNKKLILMLSVCGLLAMGLRAQNNPAYDSTLDYLRLDAPVFSQTHGFYQAPIQVSITAKAQGASIVYTTDGSDPGADNGQFYSQPVDIAKTTILRACVLGNGDYENSRISTCSYFFVDDIIQQPDKIDGYPDTWGPYAQISGTAKADYGMDPELTQTEVQREELRQGFLSLPVVSVATDKGNLFNQENNAETGGIYIYTDPPTGYTKTKVSDPGTKWLRASSVEIFDTKGELSIQEDCGLRLHGGHSRLAEKSPKHGFRLVFKEKFGNKKMKANIFGATQAKKLDNLVLRGGFCNTWIHANVVERNQALYTRDAWAKEVQAAMGHPHSHQRYVNLFLNGIYWGLYNITERIDEGWCEEYLGGYETDYDVIKVEDSPQEVLASSGTLDNWKKLFDLAAATASDENYAQIDALLDLTNFVDYMIINIYGGNTDWDRHNWLAVYNTVTPGEGFKMLCWDSEHVLKDVNQDVGLGELRSLCPSLLFKNLMKYPEFCRLVGDRIQKQCYQHGPLEPGNTTLIWTRLSDEIASALNCEAARWGDYRRDVHSWKSAPYELYTKATHYDALQKDMLENILPYRRDVFIGQMQQQGLFPQVAAPLICIGGEVWNREEPAENDHITLQHSAGTIYYSLNGQDPVSWDKQGKGSPAAQAKTYSNETFNIGGEDFCLKARTLQDGTWSALSEIHWTAPSIEDALPDLSAPQAFCLEASLPEGDIRLRYTGAEACRIGLYDMSGRLLRLATQENADGEGLIRINWQELSRGVYLLHCQDAQTQQCFKIVKP